MGKCVAVLLCTCCNPGIGQKLEMVDFASPMLDTVGVVGHSLLPLLPIT